MKILKINLRVTRERRDVFVHFCYVEYGMKRKFDRKVNVLKQTSGYWIAKWAMEDFGITKLDTWEDLETLKARIRAKFKEEYPKIFLDSNADRQGWLRVWYTQNMERELSEIGE